MCMRLQFSVTVTNMLRTVCANFCSFWSRSLLCSLDRLITIWLFFNPCLVLFSSKAEPVQRHFYSFNKSSRISDTIDGQQNRIISGVPVPHSFFPFLVSVQKAKAHHCGGSIVTNDAILTACQCLGKLEKTGLSYFRLSDMRVVAGIGYILKSSPQKQTLAAKSLIAHPQCSFDSADVVVNDVGVIRLKGSLKFNDNVKAVTVFSNVVNMALSQLRSYQRLGTECTIPGWGKTTSKGSADTMFRCRVALRTPVECRDSLCKYRKTYCGYRFYLRGQTCAVTAQRNCRPCKGDEGGPLMCEGYLFGIYKSRGCDSTHPAIYTHIEPILYMIKSHTSANVLRNSTCVIPLAPRYFIHIILVVMMKFLQN